MTSFICFVVLLVIGEYCTSHIRVNHDLSYEKPMYLSYIASAILGLCSCNGNFTGIMPLLIMIGIICFFAANDVRKAKLVIATEVEKEEEC